MRQNICPLTYFGHVNIKLVSMATPIMRFSRMGCTNKINNMSAATQPKILNRVPD